LPENNIATAANKFQNALHWLWQNGAESYPQPFCGNLPNYAVNLYKPLNSNRKSFFESRLWIRSLTFQNGFFTLQFSTPNKTLLPPTTLPDRQRELQQVFLGGGHVLFALRYLIALTKRHFSRVFSFYYRGSDAPAQTAK